LLDRRIYDDEDWLRVFRKQGMLRIS
jgi:hypothetical protein